jgi:dTDP-4-dehydrorhamnose 3,5-epimerase
VVTCIAGAAFDVALDLRSGSPTYGRHEVITLTGHDATIVYLPAGLAHGFAVLGDHAVMAYLTTSLHDPQLDDGVHWHSIGVAWPYADPVVSERDRTLPVLSELKSPFTFEATGIPSKGFGSA